MTEDDPALVALARAGDRAAFDELVRRYADGLYAVVEQREHASRDRWVQPVDGVLDLRESAVKSRLHRARELLRAGLADHARDGGAS